MNHMLRISISQEEQNGGIVGCRRVTIRERLLRILFGENRRLTVIVPGDSVRALSIIEEGDEQCEQNQIAAGCSGQPQ